MQSSNIQGSKQLLESLLKIKKGSFQDKLYGCIFGQLLGDALGAYLEFKPNITERDVDLALELPGGGNFRLAKGQITDDSEMAMELLNVLKTGKFSQEEIAKGYDHWCLTRPFDIGITTRQALYLQGQPESFAASQMQNAIDRNQNSQSNGSLMRISPLGIYSALKNLKWEEIKELSEQDTKLTHSNSRVIEMTQVWVYLLSQLLQITGDIQQGLASVLSNCDKIVSDLSIQDVYHTTQRPDFSRQIGYIGHSFTYGFQTLRNFDPKISFYSYQKEILVQGGDTDTNACILGAMLGSILGFHNIYEEKPHLIQILLDCQPNHKREQYAPIRAVLMTMELIKNIKQNNK